MRVEIDLLGDFTVRVDSRCLPADAWRQRRGAASLVKLLALAPRRRLSRDGVLAALWPELAPQVALPRLHKAAHFARRALGTADAVVLTGGVVALLPGADVHVDVVAFEAAADAAAPVASVPVTVRDAVLARVGRLPAGSRTLVQRLAVVPSRAERWLADVLAGNHLDAVVPAERSGVLSGTTGFVSFRHELARQALESSLTVGERVLAHREVLDVLLDRPDVDAARLVHHAVRAARPDLVGRFGPIAATEAERAGAHRQAAETLRAVLDLAELDRPGRATLLTRRAYSLYLVNEYENALAVADTAVQAAESAGDPALIAEALVVLSRIAYFARGPLVARRAAERAVELLHGHDGEPGLAEALTELARTHSNLATIGIVAQPSDIGVRAAERALDQCRRLGGGERMAQPLCYLGSARLALGDPRGLDDIEKSVEIGASATRLETRVRGYVNAAGAAYRAGRFDQAERYVAAGLRVAADGAFIAGRYRLILTSAGIAASAGSWDRAVAALRGLLTEPGDAGIMAPLARSLLARLLARRGEPEAHAVLQEGLRNPVAAGDSYVAGPLAVAQVEVGWLTGTDRHRGGCRCPSVGRRRRAHRDRRRAGRVPASGRIPGDRARRPVAALGRWVGRPVAAGRGRLGRARRRLRAGGRTGRSRRRH